MKMIKNAVENIVKGFRRMSGLLRSKPKAASPVAAVKAASPVAAAKVSSPVAVRPSVYVPGRRLSAAVRLVNGAGVFLSMPDGVNAVVAVSSVRRVLGDAFAGRVKVGEPFAAVVKAYYPATRQVVLTADPAMRATVGQSRSRMAVKPQYAALPQGTSILVDLANVFSAVQNVSGLGKFELAAKFVRIARSLGEGLRALGYRVIPFVERVTVDWCRHVMVEGGNAAALAELEAFASSGELVVVNGREADLVLLQNARAVNGSVVCSNDGFCDYRETFGDIVGSSRVCRFTCVKGEGCCRLSMVGLKDAVTVDLSDGEANEPETLRVASADSEVGSERQVKHWSADRKAGLVGSGEELMRKGHYRAAAACLGKAAGRGDASAYRAMAELYGRIGNSREAQSLSRRYGALSDRLAKRQRMEKRRAERQRAEFLRGTGNWRKAA